MSPKERPKERRSLELENEAADTIAHKGYQVHQNPSKQEIAGARVKTGDVVDPGRAPDYLVEGLVFDCYAPTSSAPTRSVWSAVVKKVERQQTQRVVLNLQDWRGDFTALRKQFDDWPVPALKELVAVTRSGTIVEIVRRD
ncbi:hypothetical protein V6U77_09305 [Micromonospora sp. CPCC 205546]|uniref:CdiA C-terminal domain-containing protein n=1 Tax=Micromonospora sp. CPCC 205546 TaxID=3122397 RepID=UPI002FF3833D